MSALLEIENLNVEFWRQGELANHPLRGVSLTIAPGEILGVVGETGCGKTLTGLSVLGLLPAGARPSGRISLHGEEQPLGKPLGRRGSVVSIVFQNPMTAFNPLFSIGSQIDDVLKQHTTNNRASRRTLALSYLEQVGLDEPERAYRSFPHELSGGMLQRAMIAMALVCEPELLILDEPTTALDVTIAKQILDLIAGLRDRFGFGVMLITHNLGVVHQVCDRVAVLYAGRVIESGPTNDVFTNSGHPYTRGLLGALPARHLPGERLDSIPGNVPARLAGMVGCAFAERCPIAVDRCREVDPELRRVGGASVEHRAACIRTEEAMAG